MIAGSANGPQVVANTAKALVVSNWGAVCDTAWLTAMGAPGLPAPVAGNLYTSHRALFTAETQPAMGLTVIRTDAKITDALGAMDQVHELEITVTSDVRHHVFLVVKEALTNIVRHSGARTVILRAKIEGAVLHMTIEDDGCGFDRAPDDALADGLRNMQQRMSSLGGNLRIASKAGAGTRIEFEVSVKS